MILTTKSHSQTQICENTDLLAFTVCVMFELIITIKWMVLLLHYACDIFEG